jgi:hypothetical protein
MDNIFIFAGIISVIFLIVKFLEMRFIEKENKPLKFLIRDTLLVYFSVIIGYYLVEQISPVIKNMDGGSVMGGSTGNQAVFTDQPGF